MKRLLSILFIALILFNVLGYYGIFIGLRFKNTQDLIHRLDAADYTKAETLTLKVPMAVPYADDSEEYKRVDGEIEYHGDYYRLVKQKLSHDTLYIVCLKDYKSNDIKKVLKDYVKTLTDKPVDAAQQHTKTLPAFIKDYLPTEIAVVSDSEGWRHSISYHCILDLIADPHGSSVYQPPRRNQNLFL